MKIENKITAAILLATIMILCPTLKGQSFEILKTVTLGEYPSVESLKQALVDDSCEYSNWDDNQEPTLIDQPGFTINPKKEECILALTTIEKLGFANKVTKKKVLEKTLGQTVTINGVSYIIEICPAEAGPLLRLKIGNVRRGCCKDWYYLVMNPIVDSDNIPKVFRVLSGFNYCKETYYRTLDVIIYDNGRGKNEPYFSEYTSLVFRLRPLPSL